MFVTDLLGMTGVVAVWMTKKQARDEKVIFEGRVRIKKLILTLFIPQIYSGSSCQFVNSINGGE